MQYEHTFSSEKGLEEIQLPPSKQLHTQRH